MKMIMIIIIIIIITIIIVIIFYKNNNIPTIVYRNVIYKKITVILIVKSLVTIKLIINYSLIIHEPKI